jgi:hypothetical protein
MFKMEPTLPTESSMVLLSDSDGTIFCGNMNNVINAVIRFLKKDPQNREDIDELFAQLGHDLPEETRPWLKSWLTQQDLIPWIKLSEELTTLKQTIAGFFPLVTYQNIDTREAKVSHTALDVFKAVWRCRGTVMILTFNRFAPQTIRYALIQHGLTTEEARQIFIIYPGHPDTHSFPHEKIYACLPPEDGDVINKNEFIREAQRICLITLKLTQCQFIFMDDQHAQSAQSEFLEMNVVTDDYAKGEHLKTAISLISSTSSEPRKKQYHPLADLKHSSQPLISASSGKRQLNINSHFFPTSIVTCDDDRTTEEKSGDDKDNSMDISLSQSQTVPGNDKGSRRHELLEPNLNPMSSLTGLDLRSTTEILDETHPLSWMFPQPLEKKLETAYERAYTPEQKTRVIIKAIEHFYPQIPNSSAERELNLWIKNLDELFLGCQQNPQEQLQFVKAAQQCWSKFQFSVTQPCGSDEKNSHLACVELQKWNQRQRVADSRIAASTRPCCLIL